MIILANVARNILARQSLPQGHPLNAHCFKQFVQYLLRREVRKRLQTRCKRCHPTCWWYGPLLTACREDFLTLRVGRVKTPSLFTHPRWMWLRNYSLSEQPSPGKPSANTGLFSTAVFLELAQINPLNAELNPICHLLALIGAHHILHVSRIRVNLS